MLAAYKVFAFLVFLVFVFYVFDIRNKPGMVPIVHPLWTRLMKTLSLGVLVAYVTVLARLQQLGPGDWIALGLTTAGTALVTAAKVTLGRYHTWTGFHLDRTTIVRNGVYARLRHPLYTGVFLFEFGGLTLLLPRVPERPVVLLPIVLLTVAYLMVFNVLMARRESREMARKFGSEFESYRASVRAFFPVRRSPMTTTSTSGSEA